VVGVVGQIGTERDDPVVLHEHIGLEGPVMGDDGAALDEFGQGYLPKS